MKGLKNGLQSNLMNCSYNYQVKSHNDLLMNSLHTQCAYHHIPRESIQDAGLAMPKQKCNVSGRKSVVTAMHQRYTKRLVQIHLFKLDRQFHY